jgi:hypothetical protein
MIGLRKVLSDKEYKALPSYEEVYGKSDLPLMESPY